MILCHAFSLTLTTLAFDQSSSRWFEAGSCKPASSGLPSSPVQPCDALSNANRYYFYPLNPFKMLKRLFCLSTLVVLLALSSLALSQAIFTGKVVGVREGDTIKVMRADRPVKVRIHRICFHEKALSIDIPIPPTLY
jgi:hypothetical protein